MYDVIITDSKFNVLYSEIFNYIGEIDFTETGFDDFIVMRNSILAEMLLDDEDVNECTFYSEGRDKIETLYQITRDKDLCMDYSLLYDGKPLLVNLCKRFKGCEILSADTGNGFKIAIYHH